MLAATGWPEENKGILENEIGNIRSHFEENSFGKGYGNEGVSCKIV
jgi:hypothetical protein